MKNEFCILIPAIKKNVAFPDDLVKKLGGISLIQRIINMGKDVVTSDHVFVVTDSQEISLICERNGVRFFYKEDLKLTDSNLFRDLRFFILRIYKKYLYTLILHPYAPLLSSEIIKDAYAFFRREGYDVLLSVKKQRFRIYGANHTGFQEIFLGKNRKHVLAEVRGFVFFRSGLIKKNNQNLKIGPYLLDDKIAEIKNYQDWWVCEKILKRKRIVFRVIGYAEVGMGHIYRSLALAHEITDHEIIFVCDRSSQLAVNKIAGSDYLVYVFPEDEIEDQIIALHPDLVVNDMLNTSRSYIEKLKAKNIHVVNFEDLGLGAGLADITFNELYDEPVVAGENIHWGRKYFFLRDEFSYVNSRSFCMDVKNLLITFGGTDQHNLTMKVLSCILPFCTENDIFIHIVTGSGYPFKNELTAFIEASSCQKLSFSFATEIISKIMELTDIAISSNGRTVYELGHMNIPSLIISQHKREKTHTFACPENGFIHIGSVEDGNIEHKVLEELKRLVYETRHRRKLFDRMTRFDFLKNKPGVVSLIQGLMEQPK